MVSTEFVKFFILATKIVSVVAKLIINSGCFSPSVIFSKYIKKFEKFGKFEKIDRTLPLKDSKFANFLKSELLQALYTACKSLVVVKL